MDGFNLVITLLFMEYLKMLTLSTGRPRTRASFCNGQSRRDFLRIGSLALGGLSLPGLLQAESLGGINNSRKGCIMIYLAGGPPHQDMVDLKPNAPMEFRGEFKPISTNVPGIEICELLPRMARMMDKFTIIRSIDGCIDRHDPHQILSGVESKDNMEQAPCIGSFAAKLLGSSQPGVPPFICLSPKTRHLPWSSAGGPGFLGKQYAAFRPDGDGMQDMVLNGINSGRLKNRAQLLQRLDSFRRSMDAANELAAHDRFVHNAFDVLSSSSLVDALDIESADPKLRDRYGRGDKNFIADGPWRWVDQFLMALELIQAGARFVTLAFSRWDWHGNAFGQGRRDMPLLDQGLTALVEDIHRRDLQNDVSVLVMGEFGRTPRINKTAGRDHWPKANFAILAGGGMKMGQVIGATNRLGEEPTERPIHPQQVLGMLYRALGIDVETVTVPDNSGRPQYLVERRDRIPELG